MKTKRLSCFIQIILTIFIVGCTTTPKQLPQSTTVLSPTARGYLQQASTSQNIKQQQYQILAANQLLADNNLNDANQLLNKLNKTKLDPTVYSQKLILEARLALRKNKPRTAILKLHHVKKPMSLPHDIATDYYTTAAAAHLHDNDLAYNTIALISLNSLINDPKTQQQNRETIWHNLQTLSLNKLNILLKRCDSNLLRGWIQLAIIAKASANNPNALYSTIQTWKQKYSTHPANNILPNNDSLQLLTQINVPNKIALLIPLHGKFAEMGKAIRDGFMTAFYANLKKLTQTPSIKIYDTSQNDVTTLYEQAIQNGAQFVIGPLTKTNVYNLAENADINVPTLALNYLPKDQTAPNNFIQFGLSPEQSAKQTAKRIWQHGITNILIVTPENDWGNKIKQAFLTRWQKLGGYVANSISFSEANDIETEITSVLNISQSKQRTQQLQSILGEKLKSIARRRQDINGIFLVATPNQARQIYPMLKFYYTGNIPIFSISSIYSGYPNPRTDRDLDNIYFNDMPWLLKKSPYINKLKKQIQRFWLANYKTNNRLYGLGIDTYSLCVLLPKLKILPDFAINGVTGQLYLNTNSQIYRQLLWARFISGTPKLVTPSTA